MIYSLERLKKLIIPNKKIIDFNEIFPFNNTNLSFKIVKIITNYVFKIVFAKKITIILKIKQI